MVELINARVALDEDGEALGRYQTLIKIRSGCQRNLAIRRNREKRQAARIQDLDADAGLWCAIARVAAAELQFQAVRGHPSFGAYFEDELVPLLRLDWQKGWFVWIRWEAREIQRQAGISKAARTIGGDRGPEWEEDRLSASSIPTILLSKPQKVHAAPAPPVEVLNLLGGNG